jgi:hypothetical protein
MPNTKDFIPIERITDDVAILKDGSVVMVIQTSAVNFDLLSENEQLAIIGSFAALLNSLSFSIQILIRSKKLDISHYLNTLKEAERKQTNPLLQLMMQRYRAFVAAIIRDNEVLDKQFYVILAVSPIELGVVSSANYEKNLPKAQNLLGPRRDHILKQLSRIGLKSTQLNDEKLIRLFYDIYNDEDKITLADVQANPANQTPNNAPTKFEHGTKPVIATTPTPATPLPPTQPVPQAPPGVAAAPSQPLQQSPASVVAQAQASMPASRPTQPARQPLYSSSGPSRQSPFVVEELPA